jgi:hypothetical protein
MLTTGYRANGLQIGPGLFSPMDFCFSQTFCVSAVVFLINEVAMTVPSSDTRNSAARRT